MDAIQWLLLLIFSFLLGLAGLSTDAIRYFIEGLRRPKLPKNDPRIIRPPRGKSYYFIHDGITYPFLGGRLKEGSNSIMIMFMQNGGPGPTIDFNNYRFKTDSMRKIIWKGQVNFLTIEEIPGPKSISNLVLKTEVQQDQLADLRQNHIGNIKAITKVGVAHAKGQNDIDKALNRDKVRIIEAGSKKKSNIVYANNGGQDDQQGGD